MPTLSSTDPALETHVFWELHKKKVFAVLLLALLAVAAWGGYRFKSDRRDAAAAELLSGAKTAADFQKVITQYGTTPSGASAYLFLADEQRKEKKFSEANATLQSFIDKNPQHQMKGAARMAMAANLESLGKPDEALAAYQRLATDDPQGFAAPLALIAQVHILKSKNQIEEAKRVCESVLTKYRESLVAGEATRQLRALKGNEPEKPVTPPTSTVPPLLARPPDAPPAAALPAVAPPAPVPPTGKTPAATAIPKRP